jgi:hypothetical protein
MLDTGESFQQIHVNFSAAAPMGQNVNDLQAPFAPERSSKRWKIAG